MATRSVLREMRTTALEHEAKVQLPFPINVETFRIRGQCYEILRFAGDEGPTFIQTEQIMKEAKSQSKDILTADEAKKIMDNEKLNKAFRNALGSDGWCYLGGYGSNAWPFILRLKYFEIGPAPTLVWNGRGLSVCGTSDTSDASTVVILKVDNPLKQCLHSITLRVEEAAKLRQEPANQQ